MPRIDQCFYTIVKLYFSSMNTLGSLAAYIKSLAVRVLVCPPRTDRATVLVELARRTVIVVLAWVFDVIRALERTPLFHAASTNKPPRARNPLNEPLNSSAGRVGKR
jgi:hypothetical protein